MLRADAPGLWHIAPYGRNVVCAENIGSRGDQGSAVQDNWVKAGGTSKNHFSHVRIEGGGYRGKHFAR